MARGKALWLVFGLSFWPLWTTLVPSPVLAADWVDVAGSVRTMEGNPVCAMVLANGQYMFSCDGTGAYSLNVPLDSSGDITLFAFADGFAPFRVKSSGGAPSTVIMKTAAATSPTINVLRSTSCLDTGQVRITGQVESQNGAALCAMVLANGQNMFSCGSPAGAYDLTVPLDDNQQITLFAFADGFQPYRVTFPASCSAATDNKNKTEQLAGTWTFTYQIISIWTDQYSLQLPAIQGEGDPNWYLVGADQYGDLVVGGYAPEHGKYTLLDTGMIIDQFYVFDFTAADSVKGCYYQVDPDTEEMSRCYIMTGTRVSRSTETTSALSRANGASSSLSQEEAEWIRYEENAAINSFSERMQSANGASSEPAEESADLIRGYESLLKALDAGALVHEGNSLK